jgi:type II secretory pathway component PulF
VQRATAFVEPLFLGLMGGMVAFIMASVLLPLFSLVNVVK